MPQREVFSSTTKSEYRVREHFSGLFTGIMAGRNLKKQSFRKREEKMKYQYHSRADYAARIMIVHTQYVGDNQADESNLVDLLTNLMLWCDEMAVDFEQAVSTAREHYAFETKEEQS